MCVCVCSPQGHGFNVSAYVHNEMDALLPQGSATRVQLRHAKVTPDSTRQRLAYCVSPDQAPKDVWSFKYKVKCVRPARGTPHAPSHPFPSHTRTHTHTHGHPPPRKHTDARTTFRVCMCVCVCVQFATPQQRSAFLDLFQGYGGLIIRQRVPTQPTQAALVPTRQNRTGTQ